MDEASTESHFRKAGDVNPAAVMDGSLRPHRRRMLQQH
ncbi:hypothetical protein STRAU_1704 [Streptomyces aurantiacus JA 4570]|uniref:Uncharacterized protein n=1 Tax=Streptomyces aurantiacus JA 4570 TaxID=1286094 RepID=S3ZPV2_9ACTN|nr:hypothetical protein STRAU_1704 [Streptomyces aurantiacus JA 4570]